MSPLLIQAIATLALWQDDTFRVEARVVNIEAMVRDASTRQPVRDLTAAHFRLKIDGKPRPITYFQHRGDDRRPLAMLIDFNLAPEGALRQMSQQHAQESFALALSQLAAVDEVAVYASRDWFVGVPVALSGLTAHRETSAKALQQALQGARSQTEAQRREERRDKEQSMTLAIDAAIEISRQRPDSQVVLVYVSDGMNTLDAMEARGRDKLQRRMSEHNISFSALTVDMLASYASAAAVLNPVGKMFGMSVTGSGDHFAKETGGVSVKVSEAGSIGEALGQVVSAYDSRYSLGFQAAEPEYRDEKWHKVEVRLEGVENRKLVLTARKWWKPNLRPRP